MAQLNDTMVQGDLRVTGSIYGNINGNAATATSAGKLTTARKTYVTLGTASTTTTRDWSGDTTIPVNGTLAISNGGTGATQVTGSSGALHNLTNDQIGTASQWFLTITNGWERCGYCSVADAKKVLGLGSAAYTESTAYAPSSTVSCTTTNVKSALGTSSGTSKYLREDGTWQIPPDTNTWRGIQDNLTSDSTTDSLSAAQGKKLNTNKLDKTTSLTGSTISETDIMTVNGSTDGFKMSYSATSSDLGKMKLHTIDDANAILSLGNTVSGSYKEAITIVNGSATITGSLTGNCSGSSGSCTGNAATASAAKSGSALETAINGKAPSTHAHGNIASGGTLQTNDITIASGDKLVVTDSDNSHKVARTSLSFDGSTTTKALTQKGTFETFLTSHQDISGKVDYEYVSDASIIDSNSTADSCKNYFKNHVSTGRCKIVYCKNGDEYTLIFSKQHTGSYGNIIKYGYATNTIYMLRYKNTKWETTDWEVISAGSVNATTGSSILSTGTNGSMEILNGALSSASGGGGSCSIDGDGISFTQGVAGTSMTAASIATSGTGTFTEGASAKGRPIDGSATVVTNSSLTWNAATTHLVVNRGAGSTTVIDLKSLNNSVVYWLHVPRDNIVHLKNSSAISTFYCYDKAFTTAKTTDTQPIRSHIKDSVHGGFSAAIVRNSSNFYVMMDY